MRPLPRPAQTGPVHVRHSLVDVDAGFRIRTSLLTAFGVADSSSRKHTCKQWDQRYCRNEPRPTSSDGLTSAPCRSLRHDVSSLPAGTDYLRLTCRVAPHPGEYGPWPDGTVLMGKLQVGPGPLGLATTAKRPQVGGCSLLPCIAPAKKAGRVHQSWSRRTWVMCNPPLKPPESEGGRSRRTTCLLYTSDAADDLLCVDLG